MNPELFSQRYIERHAKFAKRCDETRENEMKRNCSEFTMSFYQQRQEKPYFIVKLELFRFLNSDVVLYEVIEPDGSIFMISRKCALSKKNPQVCLTCLDNSERRDRQIPVDVSRCSNRCIHCLFHCPVINVSPKIDKMIEKI